MSQQLSYFGTDGIRGRVGEHPITPEFVLKLGWAAGRVFAKQGGGKGGKVLIGKDTRISGYMFESVLEAGLSAAGIDTYLLGPMPTPAVAYLTRTLRAEAGIVISASHNPYYDNGIKFFSGQGLKLPRFIEEAIERELLETMTTVDSAILGKAVRVADAPGRYIEFCKSTVASDMILNGLKIVIDCAHGATYHVAPSVFRELGAEVIELGVEPNGLNINLEYGALHPAALRQAVLSYQADLGIAFDGDGDRVLMIDHEGYILDGDELIYIIAKHSVQTGTWRGGGVVGTVMSNLGLEHALSGLGIDFARVAVGDRHIMQALCDKNWSLGGEPSGHIVCRDVALSGDGIITALQVLSAMQEAGKRLAAIRQGIQKYPQVLLNVPIVAQDKKSLIQAPAMLTAIQAVESALGRSGRVLLRPSGTEPLIRVMVEGDHLEKVTTFANQLALLVQQLAVS